MFCSRRSFQARLNAMTLYVIEYTLSSPGRVVSSINIIILIGLVVHAIGNVIRVKSTRYRTERDNRTIVTVIILSNRRSKSKLRLPGTVYLYSAQQLRKYIYIFFCGNIRVQAYTRRQMSFYSISRNDVHLRDQCCRDKRGRSTFEIFEIRCHSSRSITISTMFPWIDRYRSPVVRT